MLIASLDEVEDQFRELVTSTIRLPLSDVCQTIRESLEMYEDDARRRARAQAYVARTLSERDHLDRRIRDAGLQSNPRFRQDVLSVVEKYGG